MADPTYPVRLVFSQPPVPTPGPVRLVFGDDGGDAPAIPDATLHGAGRITGLSIRVAVRAGVQLQGGARITGLRVQSIAARYDSNVQRPTVGSTHTLWQDAAPLQHVSRSTWQQSAPLPVGKHSHWQDADAVAASLRALWHDTQKVQRTVRSLFEQAERLPGTPARSSYQEAWRLRSDTSARFQEAVRLPGAPLVGQFQEAYRDRQARVGNHFQVADKLAVQIASGMGIAVRLPLGFGGRYQEAWPPRPGQWQRPGPQVPEPCYTPTLPAHLIFSDPHDASLPARLVFVCERHGPGPEPQPEPGVVVPIRRVYIVINSISIHRVDTGAELRAHSFSMSLDHKSWTWSWTASLHSDAANHLARDSEGEPAELAVVVNGQPFRLRLEHITRDKRFSPTRWSVSGKGLASVLAAPYAPAMHFGNPASARTAQQLMADVLTINGVGMNWSLDWQLQDWLVPAGAWSFQGSYIDAVNDIAGAAGGYVQPHPTDSTLRILPTYPAAPWSWDAITPDFTLPASVAEVEGTDYIDLPAYNRVFVGGVGVGVFGPRTRTGTAGDMIAPQVTHALITDATVHQQRGLAELASTGRQEHITLNMQVLPETGLIVPGQFVRYMGDKPAMGIVRSTSLNWSFPKLRQSIVLETHA